MSSNEKNGLRGSPRNKEWKNKGPYKMPNWELKEDIVISGISGRFPESNNVEELKYNLFEGIDMITEDARRWKPGLLGTPKRMGKLKEVNRFDAHFFGVHGKQAEKMDPMLRIFLEAVYESIFDAGYEPNSLKGKNVGVFVGCSDRSVSGEKTVESNLDGYELLGMSQCMLANRVSFTFGFTGPSMTLDTACSSTMTALNEAYIALKIKRCDAAIVGGATINLSISNSISFNKLGIMSQDGACRVFDSKANGYVRSEAVGAMFLQRSSDARRCYASILHSKANNDGYKNEGISFPSKVMQKQLFTEVFSELHMNPSQVDYVEAHGTGTVAGDREEGNAIGEFFCSEREKLLPVGSVKSNLGHAEAASGVCTMAKIILSMEEGVIPPNLHYVSPTPVVPALIEGKIKIIDKKTSWAPGIVAANNFGFGGSNVQIILKANQKEPPERKERIIPRLALACGRTEEAVQHIFNRIQEDKFTDEALLLLEESCKAPTNGMRYRGYALVQESGEVLQTIIEKAPIDSRPVWFLFSGMGSQWSGMAKDMMNLDIFAQSIRRSAKILQPYGVDLLHLLTEATEEELNHIVAPFVTIASIQMALVDIVKELGIIPDGIIGHSVGELGCAYADGCFTAEQMLMAAYWRGKSCTLTNLTNGAMAAIGLTWEEAKRRCPPDVYPVCHNSEDSVTISGPADNVKAFVTELKKEQIFAVIVKTCNIAFHSKYVEPASTIMRKHLAKVIRKPLPRSSKWISSSVPEPEWNDAKAQLSSVDYHVNNLLSPVLFNEAMSKVPKNAIIIEFAPHSLLQAIVKRILGPEAIYVGLMKKLQDENLKHCLNSIGRLFLSNLNPQVKNLYDSVSFPVSRGTPMLNSLIKWDHSAELDAWNYNEHQKLQDNIPVDTFRGSDDEYLLGHKVDERILFPFMGFVYMAWKELAVKMQVELEDLPVIIEDFTVNRATILPKSGTFMFFMKNTDSSGHFNVEEGGSIVASGNIRAGGSENILGTSDRFLSQNGTENQEITFTLDAKDFYKELRLRGYEYGPTFQGVKSADANGCSGVIKWEGRWVSFMDAMLQIPILAVPFRALLLPTRVKSIRIDPRLLSDKMEHEIPFTFNPKTKLCRSGPVEIQGMLCSVAPRRKNQEREPVLEKQIFMPFYDFCAITEEERIKLEEYSHVCQNIASQIIEQSRKDKKELLGVFSVLNKAPQDLVEKYDRDAQETEGFVLLRILKNILNSESSDDLKNIANTVHELHSFEIFNDVLSTTLLQEKVLRPTLDIVLDNGFSSKLRILEVSSSAVIHKEVMTMMAMSSLGLLNFDCTVARLTESEIPGQYLDTKAKVISVDLNEDVLPDGNDLLVCKGLFTTCCSHEEDILRKIVTSLKPKGFLLLVERTHILPAENFIAALLDQTLQERNESEMEILFKAVGLTIVSKKKDQATSVMYLLRKIVAESSEDIEPCVLDISKGKGYSWVEELKGLLKENETRSMDRKIWLKTDSSKSGIVGFVNCLKQEPGGRNIRFIFNANTVGNTSIPCFEPSKAFYEDIIYRDLVMNVFKDDQWGMYRHLQLSSEPKCYLRTEAFLNVTKRGDLSSFKWIENYIHRDPKEVLVRINYCSLNFRDVMLASGKLPPGSLPANQELQECVLGIEFVGRDLKGKRVMGISAAKALATSVSVDRDLLMEVPDHWTMEEASTISVVYMTSYYALMMRGNMKKGNSVLIHSGTGGVGQAAISIALSMGCNVFTTVGSDEKRAFLKETFPQLRTANIFSSRNVDFEIQILEATNGKGVDIVLNSLAEDKLQASVRSLSIGGRFLEIGKYDFAMNSNLGMAVFNKNICFHGVLLDTLMVSEDKTDLLELKKMVLEGIRTGVVRPLKANVFTWDKEEEAFRFMASGKHVGKVILKICDEEPGKIIPPKPVEIPAVPRVYCHPEKSYLVTGGLGGFGFELTNWLVVRGAKKIVISSRSPGKNNYQKLWIQRWESEGVKISVSNTDFTNSDGAKDLIGEAQRLGPLGGIFHLAMVLRDGLFENLKPEDFEEVCRSKVKGINQLDELSRRFCKDLDHFVVFSSISCGRGNPGQSNYGYANSVMERVIEERHRRGLPGLAIQWGGVGDVGVVYEKMGGNDVTLKGTIPQRIHSCISLMDRFMNENNAVVSSFVPVEKAAFSQDSGEDVVTLLCKVLGVKDQSTVSSNMTLGELGMDSMMGVEIKQVLEAEFDTVLSVPEVRLLTIGKLEEIGKDKRVLSGKSMGAFSEEKMTVMLDMYLPTEILVHLNDSKETSCIFFIHPLTGHVNALRTLAKNINLKAYGLQFTENVPCETIRDLAHCYIQHIKTIQPHGPYNIAGYSYGTLIAFEMALQLQKYDQVESFFCIDGSPQVIMELVPTILNSSGTNISKEFMEIFAKTFMGNVPQSLSVHLQNNPAGIPLASLSNLLLPYMNVQEKEEEVLTIFKNISNFSLAAKGYTSSGKFRGRTTLIKATEGEMPHDIQSLKVDDYRLSQDVDGTVEIFNIKCNHNVIGGDPANEVSKIINDRL